MFEGEALFGWIRGGGTVRTVKSGGFEQFVGYRYAAAVEVPQKRREVVMDDDDVFLLMHQARATVS